MRELLLVLGLLFAPLAAAHGDREIIEPFEQAAWPGPATRIDQLVRADLRAHGLAPAPSCSDAVFVRRVYLDVLGTPPTAEQATAFLRDPAPGKRAVLIDQLLADDTFADYWSLKWADLLRIKSEFPINLWPNAVQAYHRWVRSAIHDGLPYDAFARELLTASGSNFRVAPVNFYRAVQGREPETLAAAAALTFMGARTEHWTPEQQASFARLFSRVAFKPTAEWKEEIVHLDPAQSDGFTVTMPDGSDVTVEPGEDPRAVFADWLIQPRNPWFARAMANRTWSWLMGRGIVHEPDDLRDDNPPINAALLAHLERELVRSRYDVRQLMRLILNSQTYQQSSIPAAAHPEAERRFACYAVRRLEAEVLIDAINALTDSHERYESPIPEPFTYIPEDHRTIALADGSITSAFLELFGRPPRDTGLESERDNAPTDAQRLAMIASTHIQKKLDSNGPVKQIIQRHRKDPARLQSELYLAILSREPTPAEQEVAKRHLAANDGDAQAAALDLAWALINSKEFLYRH